VLELPQALGDRRGQQCHADQEDSPDRQGQAKFRNRVDGAADRVESDAGQRQRQRCPSPEPPSAEPHRDPEEESDPSVVGDRQPEDRDDHDAGDDPGDAGGA
jgi:hypothetical protein